jgi:hydrogenase expression/formation protein HypE
VPAGVHIGPHRAEVGDAVIVSGDIGVHGVAIMSVREGLEFGTEIRSDCAPLAGLVAAMLAVTPDLHALRDPTRGGLGTALNEIASASASASSSTRAGSRCRRWCSNACSLLGLDPLYVANEGKLVAFVPPDHAEAVLAAMRSTRTARTRP